MIRSILYLINEVNIMDYVAAPEKTCLSVYPLAICQNIWFCIPRTNLHSVRESVGCGGGDGVCGRGGEEVEMNGVFTTLVLFVAKCERCFYYIILHVINNPFGI